MKYVVILGDGMADWQVEELGGKTPLSCADTPMLDELAVVSQIGMVKTIPDGMAPGSDTANLSVMGYNPEKYYAERLQRRTPCIIFFRRAFAVGGAQHRDFHERYRCGVPMQPCNLVGRG